MERVKLTHRRSKRIVGTHTLLHWWSWLETSKRQVGKVEAHIGQFLDGRPELKAEFETFLAAGGGSVDDLRTWLKQSPHKKEAMRVRRVRRHLRLVVCNDRPERRNWSGGGEVA